MDTKARMAAFLEKNANEFTEGVGKVLSQGNMGKVLAEKGLGMGLGLGAAAITAGAMAIYQAATKARDFKAMLEYNPNLHEHLQQNPRVFNQCFHTLRNMNPQFSKDPLVAGAYMTRMLENPGTAGGIATEALSHRKAFGDSLPYEALKKTVQTVPGAEYDPKSQGQEEPNPMSRFKNSPRYP